VVVVGEQDNGTPPDLAREIADAISGSRLVVMPDCGHLSTIERPEALTEVLLEWMQS
jgi:pimeloyl-ACP methyl ester carboxylesterase